MKSTTAEKAPTWIRVTGGFRGCTIVEVVEVVESDVCKVPGELVSSERAV